MQLSSTLLSLATATNVVYAAPPPPPLPEEVTALAGAEPTPTDLSLYNNSGLLKQVQVVQYIRNAQVAAFDYGIENVLKFGFSGYPRALIHNLKIWRAQSLVNIFAAETILNYFDVSTVAPCQYSFALSDFFGLDFNTTDAYLTVLIEFIHISLGFEAYLSGFAGPLNQPLASAAAAAASIEGRRAAYIKTIAGINPTPNTYDTVLPSAFAYWQLLYWTKPDTSCGSELQFPAFHPLRALEFVPSLTPHNLSPSSTIVQGTNVTFGFNNTEEVPRFAALLNQVSPPVYVPLMTSGTAAEGNASFTVPENVVGVVYASLVTSDQGQTLDSVVDNTVAGTFDFLISAT